MYLPAHFAESRPEVLAGLIAAHPFGLLVTQSSDGRLDTNPLPFLLDADPAGGPGILRGHVARANPVWQAGQSAGESVVVFQGPHGYISPAWYLSKAEHGKVVPTWNYVTVQARGTLRAIEDPAWLKAFVARLTARHESPLAAPWSIDDAPADFIDSMLRAIVGIEIELVALTGKWKVSQNRSRADRDGVVHGLTSDASSAGEALARQVRAPSGQ